MNKLFVTVVFCSIILGCSAKTEDLVGTWQTTSSDTTKRAIILRPDLSFRAIGIPVSIACLNGSGVESIDGEGTWEYQAEQDRVFLVFQKYSRKECEQPYGVMLFRLSPKQLVASANVDNAASSLVFSLSK